MRLYTKSGDKGETSLIGGDRVPKDHPRISAVGEVDELNAAIGMAVTACEDADMRRQMNMIQEHLFQIGARLADPGPGNSAPTVQPEDVERLEGWIDAATDAVSPLKNFILPGGGELAARLHLARTVCRRAERSVVAVARAEKIADPMIIYINRLADLLFAWARLANRRADIEDTVWTPPNQST